MLLADNAEAGMHRWQAALRFIGVGWYVGFSILGGVLAGLWLDGKFNTKPLFVIIGLVLGIAIAVYGAYRMFSFFTDKKQKREND
ncbi:AtpZ/AtpI family protein [Chloroflexota bacterium]